MSNSNVHIRTIYGTILGDVFVGRQKLIWRLTRGLYIIKMDLCIDDGNHRMVTINNEDFDFDIDSYHATDQMIEMSEYRMSISSYFIIAYAINNRESFKAVSRYRNFIYEKINIKNGTKILLVLCATKCDLESERVVSTEEGIKVAEEWGCLYFETSSKTGKGVDEMFNTIVKEFKNSGLLTPLEEIERNKQNKYKWCYLL
ncbi:hypothetical protein EIN_322470 [Entamoeba invadens IP1]|uniref:Uncharacterized protein n=1 Tax=Entamoeba invadens IP1 TaxID=370355 RepID=A0A0A1UCV5_ENTIV|nr:hypothetical protein EIN_322470 [Entamoeba invadens IP1]ELP93754.1 hypothetical protein EIN_322470 [Entamoeba invadens IP1]|eukprot:XP_004260525.1 hypothetical protein EIN_322470 [Entamoeba invadens IP1]